MSDSENRHVPINLNLLLFFLGLLFLFPVLAQSISFLEALKLGVTLIGFSLLGGGVLYFIPFYRKLSLEFSTGLNIYFGGLLAFFLLPLISILPLVRWFFWIGVVFLALYNIRKKVYVTKAIPIWLWSLVPIFLLYSFSNHNYLEYLSRIPTQRVNDFQDYYWFTAMIASLRDGFFHTSLYEQDTGVYHHILGLFPIAALAEFSRTPSHVANWGMMIPFGVFLAFLSVIELGSFFIPRIKDKFYYPTLLILILLLATPIHPLYAIKLNFSLAVWNGNGYTPPTLAPWNATYILGSLLALMVFKNSLKSTHNRVFFILLIPALIWAKVTNIIFVVILGVISLLQLFKGDKKLFISLVIAGIPSFLLVILFYSHSSANFTFEPGFLPTYFNNLAFGTTESSTLKGIIVLVLVMLIWGGIRWLGLFGLPKELKNFSRLHFLIGIASGFFCALLIGCLFKIYSYDNDGNIVDDSSFDILQFARTFFIYLSVFSAIGLLLLCLRSWSGHYLRIIFLSLLFVWGGVSLANFSIRASKVPRQLKTIDWSKEAVQELTDVDFKLLMMKSSFQYSGQFISAHDIGPWYLSIKNREGGCTYSYVNLDKLQLLDELLSGNSRREPGLIKFFREEGVDLLVSTPNTKARFEELEAKGLLNQLPNKKWLYGF